MLTNQNCHVIQLEILKGVEEEETMFKVDALDLNMLINNNMAQRSNNSGMTNYDFESNGQLGIYPHDSSQKVGTLLYQIQVCQASPHLTKINLNMEEYLELGSQMSMN